MKHTPGPWNIAGGNPNERTDVIKTGPDYVSHIAHLHDQWICEEHGGTAFANARLIAAAPEMYETIQRLMEQVTETGTVNVHEGIRAIALLARIDGEK